METIYLMCWKIPLHICGHLETKEIPSVQLSQLHVCFCLGVLIQNERIWPMPKSHTRLLLWGIWTMQHWQFLESQHLADNLFSQVHPQQPPDTCHMHLLEKCWQKWNKGELGNVLFTRIWISLGSSCPVISNVLVLRPCSYAWFTTLLPSAYVASLFLLCLKIQEMPLCVWWWTETSYPIHV